jgi:hypothetical protein
MVNPPFQGRVSTLDRTSWSQRLLLLFQTVRKRRYVSDSLDAILTIEQLYERNPMSRLDFTVVKAGTAW